MICTPNAVMSSPERTSLAKPSQIWGRSSIARPAISSWVVSGMCGPPCGGRDEQQCGKSDGQRDRAGEEQRDLTADDADERAGQRQRSQLGAVACSVVEREAAAAQVVRYALVDQRAQDDVLDAVRDAAEREAGEGDRQQPAGGG